MVPSKVECSFCGKAQDEATELFRGAGSAMCDDCVVLCHKILCDKGIVTTTEAVHASAPPPEDEQARTSSTFHVRPAEEGGWRVEDAASTLLATTSTVAEAVSRAATVAWVQGARARVFVDWEDEDVFKAIKYAVRRRVVQGLDFESFGSVEDDDSRRGILEHIINGTLDLVRLSQGRNLSDEETKTLISEILEDFLGTR